MMHSQPDWLPPIVSINGVWEHVVSNLYHMFDKDFRQNGCHFEGRLVYWDEKVLPDERYEEGFWHLITQTDRYTNERLFDPRRAERLPWCGPTIANSNDTAVSVWDYREAGNHIRTYIWLEAWDYVVIVEKKRQRQSEIAFLITAFHLDGESRRRNLRTKFAKRIL